MNCLVVTSHPIPDSLCNQLAQYIASQLVAAGHHVITEDLYAENFSPELTVVERESYYAKEYDSSETSLQVERLVNAQALILVFPTWWFGFPAILKGWFDRVWGPGIAFNHSENFGPITPNLDNLEKVLVVTTLGSPWWVDNLVMRKPVKRIIKSALLGTCSRKSKLQFFSLYNSETVSEQRVLDFRNKIGKAIASWAH